MTTQPAPADVRARAFRFLAKVSPPDANGCRRWIGAHDGYGYGTATLPPHPDGRVRAVGAHRFAWVLADGEIPEGMRVLHRCDVRDCVNPDHLFLGTQLDNVKDMDAKNRRAPSNRARGPRPRRLTSELVWAAIEMIDAGTASPRLEAAVAALNLVSRRR